MIDTIFIDIDDTLLDFHKCMCEAANSAAKTTGVILPQDFHITFHRINDGLWHRIEQGTLTKEGLFKVRWNTIFKELGIDYDGEKFETFFRKNLAFVAVPIEGAKEGLDYLCKKYRLFAASNAIHNQQVLRLQKAGLADQLDGIFTSEFIGYNKPAPEFFNKCLSLAESIAENSLMIGDSIDSDMIGAKNVGMKTCLLNIKQKPTSGVACVDYVINSWEEIKKIL